MTEAPTLSEAPTPTEAPTLTAETPTPTEAPTLTAETPLPVGRLRYVLYRNALLRGTGFDVGPLLQTAGGGTEPLAGVNHSLSVLRTAFQDPRLSEAVAQSNPMYHGIAFAPGRALTTQPRYEELTKRGRREVRTAHRYLRRLLGKTETNAFFGPTLVVGWAPELAEPVLVGAPAPERCVIGLSYWLVQELSVRSRRAIPAGSRGWRRDPLWRQEGDLLRCTLDDRRVALIGAAGRVWQALDLPATPRQLLATTGLAGPDLVDAMILLAPALRPWPEPPSTVVDGLGWLSAREPGDDLVAQLAKLVGEAQAAPWPDSDQARAVLRAQARSAGLGIARRAGQHYADRDVVNEDRSSPWNGRVRLGLPAVKSAHRALADLLPVLLLNALLRQADARQAVVLHTGGASAGLVELAGQTIEPVTSRSDRLHAALADLVPQDPQLAEVRLCPDHLARRLAPFWDGVQVPADDQPAALPGIDLMVAGGPPGRGRWVLSECHDDSSSAIGGITSRVQPGEGADFADFCRTVSGWIDSDRMATVIGRRRSRHITPELPGLSIELSGISAKPAPQLARAAEVQVTADGTRVVHAGRRYQLYPGDVASTLFLALSLPCLVPVPFGTDRCYTPRVVLGEIVVQRRRWLLELPPLRSGAAGWQQVADWRQDVGLPQRVFLRAPNEPKPLLIDFGDPLGLDDVTRLTPGEVICTEVLPGLEDTWWQAAGRQPAELRLPLLLRWERGPRG